MTTAIEDNQLNTELQELYLLSKHWISDLEFIERELDFLKNLFGRTFSQLVERDEFKNITVILINAAQIDKSQADLRNEIIGHLHKLEHFINGSDQNVKISLIEKHIKLEQRLHKVLSDLKSAKKTVFEAVKKV